MYRSTKELLSALIKSAGSPSRRTLLPNRSPYHMLGNQSLGENISKYYQHLAGGLPEAVGNSQKAWGITDPKYKMGVRDSMGGMNRVIPIKQMKNTDGTIAEYNYGTREVEIDPKGSRQQGSKEHELTHGLHLRNVPGNYKGTSKLKRVLHDARQKMMVNREFKQQGINRSKVYAHEYAKYLSEKGEVAVRLAEARRRYAYTHGVDVTSPEIADKALDWFINANPENYEKGLIEPGTQRQLKDTRINLKDKELMRRIMPTTTQNNRARRNYVV